MEKRPGYPHSSIIDDFTPISKVLRMRSVNNLWNEICVRDNLLILYTLGGTKDDCEDCIRLRKEMDQINERLSEMEKREKEKGVQNLADWSDIIMNKMKRG